MIKLRGLVFDASLRDVPDVVVVEMEEPETSERSQRLVRRCSQIVAAELQCSESVQIVQSETQIPI